MVKRNYDMKGVRIDRDMSDFELLAEANGDQVTVRISKKNENEKEKENLK